MSIKQNIMTISGVILSFVAMIIFLNFFFGCTLSFQNVMTSGTATDVVDSDPKTDSKVDSQITIPIKGL